MTDRACVNFRTMHPGHYMLIGLAIILVLSVIITLPGWIAAGIWGMHIFLRTVCIFWVATAVFAIASAIWIAMDPYSS